MQADIRASRQAATGAPPTDSVSVLLDQWRRERPDLDLLEMGIIGRVKRCALVVSGLLESGLAKYGLALWEFDVLATLRRSGKPYCLTPTALFATLMVSSGTMTHRLQRLQARGLIERVPDSDDARSMLVRLTDAGLALVDDAVEGHVANERKILENCSRESLAQLDASLANLLLALEGAQAAR